MTFSVDRVQIFKKFFACRKTAENYNFDQNVKYNLVCKMCSVF